MLALRLVLLFLLINALAQSQPRVAVATGPGAQVSATHAVRMR